MEGITLWGVKVSVLRDIGFRVITVVHSRCFQFLSLKTLKAPYHSRVCEAASATGIGSKEGRHLQHARDCDFRCTLQLQNLVSVFLVQSHWK